MDPSLNKYASVALVGLVMMFPIFNQVAQTSLDALYNADHEAKLDEFFKSWDDIPDDEKLAYWDGKTKPPGGQDGEFDRDDVDDDFKTKEGGPQPREGDRDGDGVPDEEDPAPDDPEVKDEDDVQRYERRRDILWWFNGTGTPANVDDERIIVSRTYAQINLTYEWEDFSGNADFRLKDESGTEVAQAGVGNPNIPAFQQDQDYEEDRAVEDHGDDLLMDYDYSAFANSQPDSFQIRVVGDYLVPVEDDGGDDDDDDASDDT